MSEDDLWRDTPAGRGACQCGAVSYSFTAGPTKATICHCRMCQRAVGGPFAALLEVPRARLTWHGTPARFASSNLATRGFCSHCGTPLSFEFKDSDMIEVTMGSLSPDFPYEPVRHHGIESRCHWLTQLDRLPELETYSTGVTSNQSIENDGA